MCAKRVYIHTEAAHIIDCDRSIFTHIVREHFHADL